MGQTIHENRQRYVCNFKSEGEKCERCPNHIKRGDAIYFISDGGYESRDGDYVCESCVDALYTTGGSSDGR